MENDLPIINKKILEAIQKHPSMKGVSKRTIYQKIAETRTQIGTWHSRRTAAAYFASTTLGIDVYRILRDNLEQLEELREIGAPSSITQTRVIKEIRESPPITVDEKMIKTFLLPSNLAVQAKKMSSIYPYFYVFENLLRYVIISVLKKKHGKNWWNVSIINKDMRAQVEDRKKAEGKYRWVGKSRGSHEIFYTDLGDLGLIINSNYDDFKEFFPSLTWVKSRVDDVEKSRNILAHNNPLPNNEMKRIRIYLQDLLNQLSEKLNR